MGRKSKLDLDLLAQQTKERGFNLLDSYYKEKVTSSGKIKNDSYLKLRCLEGHEVEMALAKFRIGRGCSKCKGGVKKEFDEIKAFIVETGEILLTEEYKNSVTKLEFQCKEGHVYKKSWKKFRVGERCYICNDHVRKDAEYVENVVSKEGYRLLSSECSSVFERLNFLCPQGHLWKAQWVQFNAGARCSHCRKEKRRLELNQLATEAAKKHGYTLLSEFQSYKVPLKLMCSKGHISLKNWNNLREGNGCALCLSENQYRDVREGRASLAIRSRNHLFCKKNCIKDFRYETGFIKSIADPIESIYRQCKPGYSVDHVLPISWYDLTDREQLKAVWSIDNLRILPLTENISISNKRSATELAKLFLENPKLIEICSKASRIPRKGHFELALKVLEILKKNQKELSSSIAV